tara:strand:+ start:549 stop:827 length:279 start_codon:yes stop_codon:yes gene_type:complete
VQYSQIIVKNIHISIIIPRTTLLKKDNNKKDFNKFIIVKITKPNSKIRVSLLKILEKRKVSSKKVFIAYVKVVYKPSLLLPLFLLLLSYSIP